MTNKVQAVSKEKDFITKRVMENIMEKQSNNQLHFPKNYSPQNAIMSAYLTLQETEDKNGKKALEVCSKESIANAILKMVVQGLTPVKNQCYFIVYDGRLNFQRSYLGTIALTKRLPEVVDVKGYPVYKNDNFKLKFDLKTCRQYVENYEPSLEQKPEDLLGAFAVVIGKDDILHTEYMDINRIRAAWGQGKARGNSPAHKNFMAEMAKKTVINRACKVYVNSSDDTGVVSDLINQQSEIDEEVEIEIVRNANKELLTMAEDDGLEKIEKSETQNAYEEENTNDEAA